VDASVFAIAAYRLAKDEPQASTGTPR
jgi:hypothetical protein